MFAAAEFQDETQYYSGALGEKVGTADTAQAEPETRDWTAGLAVYDIANPVSGILLNVCKQLLFYP